MTRAVRSLPRTSGATLASAVMVVLLGAADAVDEARQRLLGMSLLDRRQIEENLKRFDQVLTTEQQKSMRELDQRISRLAPEEKVHYLAVLRRYHNWLDSLPETVKNSVLDKPVTERIALVRSLIEKYPLPAEGTPAWIAVVDNSVGSPIEQAAMFKVWQEMTPEQRRDFEARPAGNRRPQELLRSYGGHEIIRELTPSQLPDEQWHAKTVTRLREYQKSIDPDLKDLFTKAEIKPDAPLPKRKTQEAAENLRRARMQRSVVNFYYLNQPPPRAVDTQRLTQFLGAMPPWIRETFDIYPADEARRRLTLVYRLVFPFPREFKPAVPTVLKTAPAPAVKRGVEPSAPVPVPQPNRTPPRSPTEGTPF